MKDNQFYYDSTFSQNQPRGMGKFINNFCNSLNKKNYQTIGVSLFDIKNKYLKKIASVFINFIIWEQLILLYYSKHKSFIFPYNTAPIFIKKNNNSILIIHDLIFMNDYKSKSIKQYFGNNYRRFVLPKIIKKFDNIITVSDYSKKIISEKFDINSNFISVIPNCIELDSFNFESNPKLENREKIIFHIGGEPEYKNTFILLFAFNELPIKIKNEFKLKILGIRDPQIKLEYFKFINQNNLNDKIELLNYQTDIEVENLYKSSFMYIIPSKIEGFGIPIIEAMKFGCPIISSNSSCLPEIAGNAALYFESESILDLKNKIEILIKDPTETISRIKNGYKNVLNYSKIKFDDKVESFLNNYIKNSKLEDFE